MAVSWIVRTFSTHWSARQAEGFTRLAYPSITATPWISISMPGRAKFDTVINAVGSPGTELEFAL